jgi:hypothetical protein
MLNEFKILIENIKNFRGLITEAVDDNVIIKAISTHEYVYIYYEGDESNQKGYRTIRPYVLGVSKAGNKVLRAWQDKGKSLSYSLANRGEEHDYWYDTDGKIKQGWRLFRLDRISSVYPTGKKFNNRDGSVSIPPKYNEGADSDMTSIITYVSSKIEPEEIQKAPIEQPKTGRWKRFMNANKNNRKLTSDDVIKLYDIAKRVYKKSAGKYLVAINDNDDFELIDVKQKEFIPKNAIVGNLPNLYDGLVKGKPSDDRFFKNTLNKIKNESGEQKTPTIPFDKKTFFKQ